MEFLSSNKWLFIGALFCLYGLKIFLDDRKKRAAGCEPDASYAGEPAIEPSDTEEWLERAASSVPPTRIVFRDGTNLLVDRELARAALEGMRGLEASHKERFVEFVSESKANYLSVLSYLLGDPGLMEPEDMRNLRKLVPAAKYSEAAKARKQAIAEAEDHLEERERNPPREKPVGKSGSAAISPAMAPTAAVAVAAAAGASKLADPPDIYDVEVRGNSAVIFKNGKSHNSISLCLNATGQCRIEGGWVLMESRAQPQLPSLWTAKRIAYAESMGPYQSERKAREAVRRKR